MQKTIEDIIRDYIPFVYGQTSKGWNRVYCEVCGDGSRKKGPRGGWLFQDVMAFFHCFNCGIEGSFDSSRSQPFSKEMKRILDSFNIPIKDVYGLLIQNLKSDKTKPVTPSTSIKYLDIPSHFYELTNKDTEFVRFLSDNYGLSISDHTFYSSTGITDDVKNKSMVKLLHGRLIIPFYKNSKLIYYQARDITNTSKLKYISADISKNSIIFNYDNLFNNLNDPLFILEGPLDAIHVNGIAVLENKLSKQQIELINKSPKRKIIIPDFKGDSFKMVEQGIELGWEIACPKFGSDVKDLSHAIIKYGKLFTFATISNSIKSGLGAKLYVNFLKTNK